MLMGWLWLDDTEVLNDSRLLANLECNVNNVSFTLFDDPCPGFSLDPKSDPIWEPLDYSSVEAAPWYTSGIPWSEEFLGFHVEEFTMGSTIERSVNPRGTTAGGATIGPLHRKHREFSVEVMAIATSDRGMQYGFDWLSQQLAPSDPCGTATGLIRLACPGVDGNEPYHDLYEIRDVGVLDGPVFGDSPFKHAGCVARSITFTLVAGDPCRYFVLATSKIEGETHPLNLDGDCGTASTQAEFICPVNGLPEQRSCVETYGVALGQRDVDIIVDAGADGAAATLVRGAINPGFPYLDGLTSAVGEYAATSGITDLDTLDVVILTFSLNLDDWSPPTGGGIGGWYNGANAACSLNLLSNGKLQATVRQSDGTARTVTSTVAVPFNDGDTGWVAVYINASTQIATFFTATLPIDVTPSGATVLGTASLPVTSWDGTWISSTTVMIGATATGGAGIAGRIYRAFATNGAAQVWGAEILDQTPGATSWTTSVGETWTCTGTGVEIAEPAGAYGCADPNLEVVFEALICRLAPDERVWIDSSNQRVWYDDGSGDWEDGTSKLWLGGSTLPYFFSFFGEEDARVWMEPANLLGHSTTAAYTIYTTNKVCS